MDTGNIVVSSNSYVLYEYCTNLNEDGNCVEWIQVIPYESLQNQSLANSEGNSNVLAFGLVLFFMIWIIKLIFRLFFPTTRGKR